MSRSARKAVLLGGLICGALDISSAFYFAWTLRKIPPGRILQGIAEAVLGPASYRGGAASAFLGLLLHFSIAFFWTGVFYLLSRRFAALTKWVVPAGLLYGAVVWIVMYRVVIPLVPILNSLYLTEYDRSIPRLTLRQLVIHLVCVGLPIALSIRRFAPARPEK
jgi:uncharacterized membrane protein YagU involved in acid resistance